MNAKWIKPFFILAALYDGILGLAFLFFALSIFGMFEVTPPNHLAYVQFPALLLLIFAAMFFRIAADPIGNRHLILYGAALKAAYSGTVFWHQLAGDMPSMWVPWAWADLVFMVIFLVAWKQTAQPSRA